MHFASVCPSVCAVCKCTCFPVLFPEKSFLLSTFWLYRLCFFPVHNSKACLLFRVDLETKANCLDLSSLFPSALSVSSFSRQMHFSLTVSIKTSLKSLKFYDLLFSVCMFLSWDFGPLESWWLSNSNRVRVALWHLSLAVWYVEPKAHRMKQLPGASCKEENYGMLPWQG